MGPGFGLSSSPPGKVKNEILTESHKISQNEALLFWVDLF